jgi:phenylacetate-CoA ligase
MLNVYAVGVRWHRYGRKCRRELERLREREAWPRSRREAHRDERIRGIVSHAYGNSPHYREVMDERGLEPRDIEGADDLPKLPLLTKETVRERGEALLTRRRPRPTWHHGHTSGTTGSPLSLWYDRHTCVMTNAVDWRQKRWAGMDPDEWIGLFLGRVVVPPEQDEPPFWRPDHVQRQVWFSTFHMDEGNLGAYVEEIRKRGLRYLEGYPSTLFILANYLIRNGAELPMEAVFTSSETLHEVQRETIEQAFRCEIFDYYGLAERVLFAAECEEHEGKHVAEEYGHVEVVDEEGRPVEDGEPGYLVGTSLHNTAMPMIRYRTRDVSAVVREPCACGRTLLRIHDVTTKAEDIVVTPDGRMISPSILTHPFKPFDEIVKSQIVQDRPDRIRVKILPSEAFGEEEERELTAGLRERLGPEMGIEVERVDELPPEPSGKFRWVISRVDHEYRFDW